MIDNYQNAIGANNSNNKYNSSNVAANADGSILERLEDLKANGFTDTDITAILEDTGTTLPALLTTIDTVVDAIKAVTDNLPDSGALTTLLASIAAILEDTGTTLQTDITSIDSKADNIINDITAAVDEPPTEKSLQDILHKDGNYTFDNTTDSLEAISDNVTSYMSKLSVYADGGTHNYPDNVGQDSILAYLMTKGDPALITDFDNSTDSLEAISDKSTALQTDITSINTKVNYLLDGVNVLKTNISDGTNIPNNSQAAGGLLATATGDVLIEEITTQTDGTANTGPTNYEFSTDNAKGLTGVDFPLGVMVAAKLGANATSILTVDGTTKQLPFVLENGKKLYIHGDDAVTATGGSIDVFIKHKGIGTTGARLE